MSYSECVRGGGLCTGCMDCYGINVNDCEDFDEIYDLMPASLEEYLPIGVTDVFEFIKMLFEFAWAFEFDENYEVAEFSECAKKAVIKNDTILVDWGGKWGLQKYEKEETKDWTTVDIDSYFALPPKKLMYMSDKISDMISKKG